MGSGKTSVGIELARRTGRSFFDTDDLVEKRAGKPVASIFAEEGEASFRDTESSVIKELKTGFTENAVIATGGGAIIKEENRKALADTGPVIWLTAGPEEILSRVRDSDRPLLRCQDKKDKIKRLLALRQEHYRQVADYIIETDGKTPEEVAAEIIEKEMARK